MRHRIAVARLRVGMYVVAMDCSWLSSPFWRTRFLVERAADIAEILAAGVETVTIDDALGLGLEQIVAAALPTADELPILVAEVAGRRRVCPREDAGDRARRVIDEAKAVVKRAFDDVRHGGTVRVDDMAPVVDGITASLERDRTAIINVSRLKNRDEYTYLHSIAVCALMANLARHLGQPPEEVRQAGLAGLLHDIGKMATPLTLLEKAGRLDPDERRIVQNHPAAGHELLRHGDGASPIMLDVCLHHHERIDGRGYPHGLAGSALSIHARMSAICDVYDAITSARPYKQPWAPARALAKMLSWEGHFDPRLLRSFIASIGIQPTGALVRLHSNRLGVVLGEGATADTLGPVPPLVRVFYDVAPARFIAAADVATHHAAGGDPIISSEAGERWFGADWPALAAALADGLPLDDFGAVREPVRRVQR